MDPDEIDPAAVVRAVVQGGREKASSPVPHSGIESALAFDNFAFGIIRERLKAQKKASSRAAVWRSQYLFDAELPGGIDDIKGEVFCEIKFINPSNQNLRGRLLEIASRFDDAGPLDGTILLIVNVELPKELREYFEGWRTPEHGNKLIIWDRSALAAKVNPDADYAKYAITPKKALVEDTLAADPSDIERENTRRSYLECVRGAYRKHDLMLFLGAGVSMESGIPLWSSMVEQLLLHMISAKVRNKQLTEKEVGLLNNLALRHREESPLSQMRYIRSAFSDNEYYELVHKVMYSHDLSKENKILDAIAKISAPQYSGYGVKGIVTYNFDDLLELRLAEKELEYNTIFREDDRVSTTRLNIYHVHGFLPSVWQGAGRETHLIFSEEDYHRVYRDAFSWSNLTQLNAFRDNTCLFIGCSLTDPNLRRLLDVAARNKESPRHYVILRKNKIEMEDQSQHSKKLLSVYQRIDDNIREGFFRELGLNIIWVDSYQDIPGILVSLKD